MLDLGKSIADEVKEKEGSGLQVRPKFVQVFNTPACTHPAYRNTSMKIVCIHYVHAHELASTVTKKVVAPALYFGGT